MPDSILEQAAEKRARISAWLATAIGLREAEERGLVQITNTSSLRNWTCREALYDFSLKTAQSDPVLVRLDERRGALFGRPNRAERPPFPPAYGSAWPNQM